MHLPGAVLAKHAPLTAVIEPELYGLCLLVLCSLAIVVLSRPPLEKLRSSWFTRPKLAPSVKASTKNQTVADERLPDPTPLHDFDLRTATTRNHLYVNKTVRWPYFQTMAHQPMHIDNWIEIDKDFDWYISEKQRIIGEQGKVVLDSLPENDEAAGELLSILVDYLPKRYPTLFLTLPEDDGILNIVTNDRITKVSAQRGVGALRSCSKLVQDDFLMAREREDGHVYFVGGLVAMPGFYLLSEKIGKPMNVVHSPVPQFNEKLLVSVERTLKKFPPHQPFERTSWEIVDDRNLFWHNIASLEEGQTVSPKVHPRDLFFRVDHQTFRKLPRTNGIVFGVHPIMKRLEDLRDSPLIPALLAKVHLEGDRKLMKYKVVDAYQVPVLEYLAELTQSQIERGSIKEGENVADFRELVQQGKYPSQQTSLRYPTASELSVREGGDIEGLSPSAQSGETVEMSLSNL